MKEKIHPNYGKAVVRCACGETFETGSVKKEMRVDICSADGVSIISVSAPLSEGIFIFYPGCYYICIAVLIWS